MKRIILSCITMFAISMYGLTSDGLPSLAASTAMPPVGGTATLKVADISHNNDMTKTNWATVKSNLDAIYIKAAEGSTSKYDDPTAGANADSAKSVGLAFGFYEVFSDSKPDNTKADTAYAALEADHFYAIIKSYSYSCVPVLDLEGKYTISASQVTADVKAFANEFKTLSGQDIMIYCNPDTANTYLDASLSSYMFWLGNPESSTNSFPDDTNVWHEYTMWQYSKTGTVGGMTVNVDFDKATDGIFITPAIVRSGKINEILNYLNKESLSLMQRLSLNVQ